MALQNTVRFRSEEFPWFYGQAEEDTPTEDLCAGRELCDWITRNLQKWPWDGVGIEEDWGWILPTLANNGKRTELSIYALEEPNSWAVSAFVFQQRRILGLISKWEETGTDPQLVQALSAALEAKGAAAVKVGNLDDFIGFGPADQP